MRPKQVSSVKKKKEPQEYDGWGKHIVLFIPSYPLTGPEKLKSSRVHDQANQPSNLRVKINDLWSWEQLLLLDYAPRHKTRSYKAVGKRL